MKLKATEPELLAAMRTASSASEPSFACEHLQIGRNAGTNLLQHLDRRFQWGLPAHPRQHHQTVLQRLRNRVAERWT